MFLRAVANWQGLKPRSGTIWITVTGQVVTLVLMVIGRGSDVREPFFSFFFLSGYNSLDRPDFLLRTWCLIVRHGIEFCRG